jgi:outer membrane protein OmpA-like peptidoglycan-associated protein
MDDVERAAQAGADVALVVNGGTPTLEQASMASTAKNGPSRERDAERASASLAQAVTASRAATPESDLLSALDDAARSLIGKDGWKTLVVIDSGLQTAGPLRFQEPGVLAADPEETAEFLSASGALPDLTGMRVVFSGLGDTAPPQEPLTPGQREHLTAIWTAVAERSGAAEVEIAAAPLTGQSAPDLPQVTAVPIPAAAAVRPLPTPRAVVTLTEEVVAFLPASTEYRSPEEVVRVLRPLAERIRSDGGKVTLTGTTSSAGAPDGRRRLSLQRAEAVKASLVELGAPTGLLVTVGVGNDWPGYVADRDTLDRLLPGPAARNRSVVVELAG